MPSPRLSVGFCLCLAFLAAPLMDARFIIKREAAEPKVESAEPAEEEKHSIGPVEAPHAEPKPSEAAKSGEPVEESIPVEKHAPEEKETHDNHDEEEPEPAAEEPKEEVDAQHDAEHETKEPEKAKEKPKAHHSTIAPQSNHVDDDAAEATE